MLGLEFHLYKLKASLRRHAAQGHVGVRHGMPSCQLLLRNLTVLHWWRSKHATLKIGSSLQQNEATLHASHFTITTRTAFYSAPQRLYETSGSATILTRFGLLCQRDGEKRPRVQTEITGKARDVHSLWSMGLGFKKLPGKSPAGFSTRRQ